MSKDNLVITGADESDPKPGKILSFYDGLSNSSKKLVHKVTCAVAMLLVMGGATAWKLSEPQKKALNTLISQPLESMRDDDIINLFRQYGIDIYDEENRIFFNLRGGGVGIRMAEKFGKGISLEVLLKDPAFQRLFQDELSGVQNSQEFIPPKAIPVLDDGIPVATPVSVSRGDKVPKAIPVRIATPVATPVR